MPPFVEAQAGSLDTNSGMFSPGGASSIKKNAREWDGSGFSLSRVGECTGYRLESLSIPSRELL